MFLGIEAEARISAEEFSAVPLVRRLAVAVDRGDRQAIAAAVAAGADVNAFGLGGFRLLDWAMARNNAIGFESLLQLGADVMANYRDPQALPDTSYNCIILQRVLEADSPEFIEAVLRNGMHPDHVPFPQDGRSLAFFALRSKDSRVLAALLAAGASASQRDRYGNPLLSDAGYGSHYKAAWLLLQRGADPMAKDNWGNDFVSLIKEYGSRGVRPGHRESFEKIVSELVRRGLLTQQDIVEADKPKQSVLDGPPGITVIEHAPDSEAAQAIRQLDQAERDANARDRAERGR
jgi:hypothetical protein